MSSEVSVFYRKREFRVSEKLKGADLLKILDENAAERVLAVQIDGKTLDLAETMVVGADSSIEFVLSDEKNGLEVLRHSTAHMLVYAVQELYGGEVKFAIGPVIEGGFYYDFDLDSTFSENNFEKIETKIRELVERNEVFSREEWPREAAIEYFRKRQQIYKVEIIEDLADASTVSIYRVGNFVDLCRGVHVPSAGYVKHFKLLKIAGAYWRGDSRNKMLQRIYGTAWDSKEGLDNYLRLLKEAEKKDHKKICRAMDIAHFEYEFAPGAPFYHPNGLYMFNAIVNHLRKKQEKMGYIEVSTPGVMDRSLWEISGHWELYGKHNFSGTMEDGRQFCVKPMNCPGGVLIYKHELKSYRDLPLKMAEFGRVNRYEASGALNGFLRVREFTQDDAHIFCSREQLEEECIKVIRFIMDTYRDFGFENNVKIKLSTRPENRIGDDSLWDLAEKSLSDTVNKLALDHTIFPGEGAFYGPKLEFVLRDALGRDWQVGTLQLDMNLPKRFGLSYIDRNGEKQEPVMLHRAIIGSIERFLGIFIEHTEGKFPLWLNPVQMCVATISEEANDYAEKTFRKLKNSGFRVVLDNSGEKINYKIREVSLRKIPYTIVLGKKEKEENNINVRIFGIQGTFPMTLRDFTKTVKDKVKSMSLDFNLV